MTVMLTGEADADRQELADLSSGLRDALLSTDVLSVEPVASMRPPPGSKGVDVVAAGALLVAAGSSMDSLRSVIATVRDWIGRQPARSVTISLDGDALEISHVSAADQRRLIDAWIARHAGST